MARFRSVGCIVIGAVKHAPNTVFCDSVGSMQAGDVLWTGLNARTVGPNLVPLDGGAHGIMAASIFANTESRRLTALIRSVDRSVDPYGGRWVGMKSFDRQGGRRGKRSRDTESQSQLREDRRTAGE